MNTKMCPSSSFCFYVRTSFPSTTSHLHLFHFPRCGTANASTTRSISTSIIVNNQIKNKRLFSSSSFNFLNSTAASTTKSIFSVSCSALINKTSSSYSAHNGQIILMQRNLSNFAHVKQTVSSSLQNSLSSVTVQKRTFFKTKYKLKGKKAPRLRFKTAGPG